MSNEPKREFWFDNFSTLKKFLSISALVFVCFNLFGICQQLIFDGIRGAIVSGVVFHINMFWFALYIMNYVFLRKRGLIDKRVRTFFEGAAWLLVSIVVNLVLRILFL